MPALAISGYDPFSPLLICHARPSKSVVSLRVSPFLHNSIQNDGAGVTCPLWLYHLLCESRTVGHDGFRCRWAIAQRTVGPNLIVGLPPALHEHLYLPECIKQFPIQQFIT